VQSGKTASGGCSAGQGFFRAVAPQILLEANGGRVTRVCTVCLLTDYSPTALQFETRFTRAEFVTVRYRSDFMRVPMSCMNGISPQSVQANAGIVPQN
jgi:hypothetical protein